MLIAKNNWHEDHRLGKSPDVVRFVSWSFGDERLPIEDDFCAFHIVMFRRIQNITPIISISFLLATLHESLSIRFFKYAETISVVRDELSEARDIPAANFANND
jgi:hypothetical protein